jgi:acetyl-CoA carboxylase biotin carboxyl carrier protein
MDVKEIKKLIELMCEMALTEIEVEEAGKRIRIRKESFPPVKEKTPLPPSLQAAEKEASPPVDEKMGDEDHRIVIRSPIVGTFYKSPSPDADPYVEIGDVVKKGQVLCIVEAMKLMNEIESDVEGKIAEICVEDGASVEYGEPLFKIEPLK